MPPPDAPDRPPTGERPWGEVPAEIATLLRPGIEALAVQVIAAVRAEVPEYDQPLEGEFGRLMTEGVTIALDQFVGLLGDDRALPALGNSEALGRAEHRAGRTLDALQSAYRVGARVAWRAVSEVGEASGTEPAVMYRLAEAIFAYIDRLAAASVAGFAQADALRAGTLQARRQALVEQLAAPVPADPAELAQMAGEAGLAPPPARVAALVTTEVEPPALARRLPAGSIGATLGAVGVVLLADPEGPGRAAQVRAALRGRRAVIGPSVAWTEARVSIERAQLAWPLHAAGRLGDDALARADDHTITLLLAASPRLAADLAARRLAPLDEMTPAARARAHETLRAWLDAHGDVSAAAQALHVHAQTVRYRLAGLREALGAEALDDPGARLELLLALQAATASFGRSEATGDGAASASPSSDGPPPGKA